MTRLQKAELRKINWEAVTGTAVFLAVMMIGLVLFTTL